MNDSGSARHRTAEVAAIAGKWVADKDPRGVDLDVRKHSQEEDPLRRLAEYWWDNHRFRMIHGGTSWGPRLTVCPAPSCCGTCLQVLWTA